MLPFSLRTTLALLLVISAGMLNGGHGGALALSSPCVIDVYEYSSADCSGSPKYGDNNSLRLVTVEDGECALYMTMYGVLANCTSGEVSFYQADDCSGSPLSTLENGVCASTTPRGGSGSGLVSFYSADAYCEVNNRKYSSSASCGGAYTDSYVTALDNACTNLTDDSAIASWEFDCTNQVITYYSTDDCSGTGVSLYGDVCEASASSNSTSGMLIFPNAGAASRLNSWCSFLSSFLFFPSLLFAPYI